MPKKLKHRIEQRNRYLEDIGLKFHEYGVNYTSDDVPERYVKKWKERRGMYGFDERETYEVFGIIDLSCHTIDFEGRAYSQIEATDKAIKWTGYYLIHRYDTEKRDKAVRKLQKAARLWAELLPYT